MSELENLIPLHGGYRRLKAESDETRGFSARHATFQVAQLVYDVMVRFCDRYINKRSRTHDQMVQAARSGAQNIAEGSQASGTSKKTELKLTNVARASLEELRLDYEDFLRQRGLEMWAREDARRAELIARRCTTAEQVAEWVREVHERQRNGRDGLGGPGRRQSSKESMKSTPSTYPEIAATAALVLMVVAVSLLDRQLAAQTAAFEQEGGFTERLYRVRRNRRVHASAFRVVPTGIGATADLDVQLRE